MPGREREIRRMGPELDTGFLRRLRRATLAVGLLGVLALATYVGGRAAAAGLGGLLLSLLNIKLLEETFARLLRPRAARSGWSAALPLLLKFPLLFGAVFLALGPLRLPPLWFLGGFSLLVAVAFLKALGLLLTAPGRRLQGSPRTRLTALLLCALLLTPAFFLPASHLRAAEARANAAEAARADAPAPLLAQEDAGRSQEPGAAPSGTFEKEEASEQKGNEAGEPELPNILGILKELNPGAPWAEFLFRWENPIFAWVVILFMSLIAIAAYRKRTMIPGTLQNVVEYIVESFSNFILGILGPRGREFVPFLGTLFFYIWLNNLQGLIPFLKSPTSVFNTTVALGICVFCYVQYTGITKLGPIGYVHHMMGSPRDVIGWCMVPLLFPLHVIEEVAKPVSLSLRLFGNILGEDVLLGVFAGLGLALLAFVHSPVGIPLHLPFIFLSILMSTIQALVFSLLATIYFSQMLPHEEEEEFAP